jgi:hypothetical protein
LGLPRCPLGADAREQLRRRLVGRILLDELSFEGPAEDGLAEGADALELNPGFRFSFVSDAEKRISRCLNVVEAPLRREI